MTTTFLRSMVLRADRNRKYITEDYASVLKLVDRAPVALAIWPDAAAPDGFGYLVLKAEVATRWFGIKVEAVPCADLEQAETLCRVVDALRPEIARGTT